MGLITDLEKNTQGYNQGDYGYGRLVTKQARAANDAINRTIAEAAPENTVEALNARFPLFAATEKPRQSITEGIDTALKAADEYTSGWAGDIAGALGFGLTMANPTAVAGKAKATAHKGAANIPNDLPGFYLSKADAESRAKNRLGGYFYEKNPQAAMKFEQGLSQFAAVGKGFAKGLQNALYQSFTPEGRALWEQKGVSKTLEDLAKETNGPTAANSAWGIKESKKKRQEEAYWGQPAYERILGSQYGKKSPILSQLDSEYFTHEGVFSYDDFKKLSGHESKTDSDAFFRTIAANNGIGKNDEYVMLIRQPTGTEASGSILTELMHGGRNPVVSKIEQAFNPAVGFNSGESFLRFYDKGKRTKTGAADMSEERRAVIRKAYRDNPDLKGITDRQELIQKLGTAVKKAAKDRGVKPFGVGNYVSAALKRRDIGSFDSNDDLAKALQAQGLNPIRNSTQKNDPDVFIVSSMHSSAYELGGVNLVYKVEKDGTLKGQMNDVNDLLGVGAPMGMPLITVTPVQTRKIGGKKQEVERRTSHARSDVYQDVLEPYSPSKANYAEAGVRQASAANPLIGAAGEYQDERVKGMLLD